MIEYRKDSLCKQDAAEAFTMAIKQKLHTSLKLSVSSEFVNPHQVQCLLSLILINALIKIAHSYCSLHRVIHLKC